MQDKRNVFKERKGCNLARQTTELCWEEPKCFESGSHSTALRSTGIMCNF